MNGSILGEGYIYDEARCTGIEDPKVGHTREIHSNSIGRWEQDLSRQQVQLVDKHLSRVMEGFGYISSE